MYSCLLGIILLCLSLVARADDHGSGGFQWHGSDGLFSPSSSSNTQSLPVINNDPAYYGGSEDAMRLQAAHAEAVASMRDRLYNSLGISNLIPRGSFMTGGFKTDWTLSTPNRNTLQLSFHARW